MPYYYKEQDNRPIQSETELTNKGLTAITETEYNALIHREEVCAQLAELKFELKKTDYVVLKIAETDNVDEIAALRTEYATVIARRKEIRTTINTLENELKGE